MVSEMSNPLATRMIPFVSLYEFFHLITEVVLHGHRISEFLHSSDAIYYLL